MQDSLKGVLVALTVIALFMTSILNFIVIFPQEQGVEFSGSSGYITIKENNDTEIVSNLNTIDNQSTDAFNQWDVTEGYMGTNQLKQGQGGIKSYSSNIFSNLRIIGTELFGSNSPIVYAIGIFSLLASSYLLYVIIKFVRSGS